MNVGAALEFEPIQLVPVIRDWVDTHLPLCELQLRNLRATPDAVWKARANRMVVTFSDALRQAGAQVADLAQWHGEQPENQEIAEVLQRMRRLEGVLVEIIDVAGGLVESASELKEHLRQAQDVALLWRVVRELQGLQWEAEKETRWLRGLVRERMIVPERDLDVRAVVNEDRKEVLALYGGYLRQWGKKKLEEWQRRDIDHAGKLIAKLRVDVRDIERLIARARTFGNLMKHGSAAC